MILLHSTLSLKNSTYELFSVCGRLIKMYQPLKACSVQQEPCGFVVSRIELLCSPACPKGRPMQPSRGLPAEAIPSVVKI